MGDRILMPPNAVEAEEAVLGSLLLEPGVLDEVARLLRPDDFYREANGAVYAAALALWERGEPVDYLTVQKELERRGQMRKAEAGAYLAELLNAVPTALHAEAYARQVQEAAVRRRVFYLGHEAVRLACNSELTLEQVLAAIEGRAFGLREGVAGMDGVRSLAEVMAEVEAQLEEGGPVRPVGSGFGDLDRVIEGWRPGSLNIVGARPARGKTSLLLGFAVQAARQGRGVVIFSLEMTAEEIAGRLVLAEAGVRVQRVEEGFLASWQKARRELGGLPIWVDDSGGLTLPVLRSRALRLARRVPLALVVVDYIQLLGAGVRVEQRYQELGIISRGLKGLAKEMGVAVVAAAQLSRAVEQRSNSRPVLADLRESGDLEQEADTVLLLHRPESGEEFGPAELIVAKNRHGPTGSVKLLWQGERARFVAPLREQG